MNKIQITLNALIDQGFYHDYMERPGTVIDADGKLNPGSIYMCNAIAGALDTNNGTGYAFEWQEPEGGEHLLVVAEHVMGYVRELRDGFQEAYGNWPSTGTSLIGNLLAVATGVDRRYSVYNAHAVYYGRNPMEPAMMVFKDWHRRPKTTQGVQALFENAGFDVKELKRKLKDSLRHL